MVGTFAGIAIRRAVPATAATLVVFVGLRLALVHWARPNLASPVHASLGLADSNLGFLAGPGTATPFVQAPSIANAWVYSAHLADRAGHVPSAAMLRSAIAGHCPALTRRSPNANPAPRAFHACVGQLSHALHLVVTYQPADRYGSFQIEELLICLGLSLAVLAAGAWWLRRRLV